MKRKRSKPELPPLRIRSWRPELLHECEQSYLAGDRAALAHAIAVCAKSNKPLPDWAATAFVAGYRNLVNYHADSWDTIFGPVRPKGQHKEAFRKQQQMSGTVSREIQLQHESGKPIDDVLFNDVGRKFGISKTVVKQYYAFDKSETERVGRELALMEKTFAEDVRVLLSYARGCQERGATTLARYVQQAVQDLFDKHLGKGA